MGHKSVTLKVSYNKKYNAVLLEDSRLEEDYILLERAEAMALSVQLYNAAKACQKAAEREAKRKKE